MIAHQITLQNASILIIESYFPRKKNELSLQLRMKLHSTSTYDKVLSVTRRLDLDIIIITYRPCSVHHYKSVISKFSNLFLTFFYNNLFLTFVPFQFLGKCVLPSSAPQSPPNELLNILCKLPYSLIPLPSPHQTSC